MPNLSLVQIPNSHPVLLRDMAGHYSKPKGFVGRNICYAVMFGDVCYGTIVAGSATLHLPGREAFWLSHGIRPHLDRAINNVFFHVEGPYPCRNFTSRCLELFRSVSARDWLFKYGDTIDWFETLVEPPLTGETYLRDKWTLVGETKGFTCKRGGGQGSDSYGGTRIWDRVNLRPKLVFMKRVESVLVPETLFS